MPMDPVVALAEEIRLLDKDLAAACRQNEARYCIRRTERINQMLERIKRLYASLFETVPSSPMGAAELIGVVIQGLPTSHSGYAGQLGRIAARLEEGGRQHDDLVWLRALAEAFAGGQQGERNTRLALLLSHAVRGISQPVVVFRAVEPWRRAHVPWPELALGPR